MKLTLRISLALLALVAGPALAASSLPPGAPVDASNQLPKANNLQFYNQLPPLATASLKNAVAGANIPTSISGSNFYEQGRTPLFARDTLSTGVVVGVPCFYVTAASSNEEHILTTGSYSHVTIEDAAGNLTQVTFSGGSFSAACSGATNGILVSDAMTLTAPIPAGQVLWAKLVYSDTTNGILLSGSGVNIDNGGALQFSGSPISDLSSTPGPITPTGNVTPASGNMLFPVFVAAPTRARSFCLYGTSRTFGLNDLYDGATADRGNLGRSIGPYAPYINIGLGSDRTDWFIASHTARVALDAYCTDDFIEHTINDVTGGLSAATIEANLGTMRGYLSATHKVHLPTTEPVSSLVSVSMSSLVANGNGLTATVASTSLMYVGEVVTIAGATPSTDNGACIVGVVTSSTVFSCTNPLATGTATASGTITYTDGYAQPANQTAAPNNAVLTAVNTWKRALTLSLAGFWSVPELADAVMSGRNSGKWRAATAPYPQPNSALTVDGTHMGHAGYMFLPRTGVLAPAVVY